MYAAVTNCCLCKNTDLETDRNSQIVQNKWNTAKAPISQRVLRKWHMFNECKSRREWIFKESGKLDYRLLGISATWTREKGMLQITIPSSEIEENFVILVHDGRKERKRMRVLCRWRDDIKWLKIQFQKSIKVLHSFKALHEFRE